MYVAIVRDAQQVQTYHGKNEIYPTSEDQNLDRNKASTHDVPIHRKTGRL